MVHAIDQPHFNVFQTDRLLGGNDITISLPNEFTHRCQTVSRNIGVNMMLEVKAVEVFQIGIQARPEREVIDIEAQEHVFIEVHGTDRFPAAVAKENQSE